MKVSHIWIVMSGIMGVLVFVASLLGIFNPATYAQESANWAMQGRGQDVGNLIALVVLAGCLYGLYKGLLKAYWVWVGVELYVLYAYVLFAFFIHFNYLFMVYVAILGLGGYSLIGALAEQDLLKMALNSFRTVRRHKVIGSVLMGTGVLFAGLWLSQIIPALLSGTKPESLVETGLWVNPVQVIDLAWVLPGMILTGWRLWHRNKGGYLWAGPWLTFSVLMGTSIVVTMGMQFSQGEMSVMAPMVIVGLLVLAALVALTMFMSGVAEQDGTWGRIFLRWLGK